MLDLDHNCLSHYELPPRMEEILFRLTRRMEEEYDFDPYSGRKLYSYLYDLGYEDIQLELMGHHLIYGEVRDEDVFNWIKKLEVAFAKAKEFFREYLVVEEVAELPLAKEAVLRLIKSQKRYP